MAEPYVEMVMHIHMGYNDPSDTVHCTQLSRTAVDAIGLNPVTSDIDHCKGYVVIFKSLGFDETETIIKSLQDCFQNECVACVIVNSEDSFDVPSTNKVNFDKYPFPVYLLKRQDGMHLLEMNSKSTKMSVKTEVVQSKLQKLNQFVQKVISSKQSPEFMLKYYRDNWTKGTDIAHARDVLKTSHHLFAKFDEEVLYDMDAINECILFSETLESTFPLMFPVYIFYISTIMSKPYMFYYNGKKECIQAVAEEFCTLIRTPRNIFSQMQQFRSEDRVRWKSLATSFLNFIDHWKAVNESLPQNFFEIAIPLIVMAQMILKDSGAPKHEFQKLWYSHLLKHSSLISFRQQGSTSLCHLHSFKEGMAFLSRHSTVVPHDFYFSPKHFKELLVQSKKIVSFLEVSNALLCLPNDLKYEWQSSFLSDFVMPLRDHYDSILNEKKYSSSALSMFCSQSHWTSFITEGLGVVHRINKFVQKHDCKESFLDKSFQWLLMLAKCINFKNVQKADDLKCIDSLLDDSITLSKHLDFLKEKLSQQLKSKLCQLSPKEFLFIENYTKEKGISDNSIFKEYLWSSKISSHIEKGDMICSKSSYSKVLKQYIIRISGEPHKSGILDLLEPVYAYYAHSQRIADFFLDLMYLQVQEVTTGLKFTKADGKNFREFLHKKLDFSVSKAIFDQVPLFMEASTCFEDELQLAVCQVVLEGFQKFDLKIHLDSNVSEIIGIARSQINCGTESLLLILKSPRLKFICGVVGVLVSKVNLETEFWITSNPGIVNLLETLQPLYIIDIHSGGLPEFCCEARTCLKLFVDVKQKVIQFNGRLKDSSICFNDLDHFRKENCFQKLIRITEIIGVENVTENMNKTFDTFIRVRTDITKILLPSFSVKNRNYCGSLFCVLDMYQISLPEIISEEVFDTIDQSEVEKIVKECKTGSIDYDQLHLKFNGSKNLVQTEKLLDKLRVFLGPALSRSLPIICFFQHFESTFFIDFTKRCLEYSSTATNMYGLNEFKSLSEACEKALSIICRTAEGNVTLKELGLDISEDTRKEIAIFEVFAVQRNSEQECYGHEGFKALVSLSNVHEGVRLLEEIFDRFQLEFCIKDSTFQSLLSKSSMLRVYENVPLKTAFSMKKVFHNGLPNIKGNFEVYFDLYRELKNYFQYVQFLRNKGFVGEAGKRKFSQERNLITQEIQQTLEQRILDDLWDAYSVLSHFLDTKITYDSLKGGLEKLNDIEKCMLQIKALRQHSIKDLDRVFALKESETRDSKMFRIRKLMNYGTAVYSHSNTNDKNSPIALTIEITKKNVACNSIEETVDLKALSEVTTAAELLSISMDDKDQDFADIKLFLWIYECCLEIMDVLEKLKNTGHFEYQQMKDFRHSLAKHELQWKTKLDKLKTALVDWERDTPLLREKYEALSFFSNRKIYEMYKIITSKPLDATKLEKIIWNSLLFADMRDAKVPSDELAKIVDACLPDTTISEPFSVVGAVIQSVWEKFFNSSRNKMKTRSHSCLKYDSNHICLHLLTDCTNQELYSTALHLLHDFTIMRAFQILTCTTVTTQEAVTLFFQRVKFLSHFRRFILIDVNVLSLKLQEVVMKECTKLLKHGNKNSILYDIIFIESRPSIIRTMPWCFLDNISLDECDSDKIQDCNRSHISCKLVYGHAGNGKSHYIQSEIVALKCPFTTIPVNESFSVQKCIQKLNDAAAKGWSFAIHLNFTIPYLKTYAITEEENFEFQMTCKLINSFFFNLLMCGYVEDFHLGESFSTVQTEKIHLFVEVPVLSSSENEMDYIKNFQDHFPVFFFLEHEKKLVDSTENFDVSIADTMLVCKYFDAEKNAQLDRLYKAPKKRKKQDEGINIESSYNLSEEKGSAVLKDVFRQQRINNKKIYQKMFVRYMYRRCKFMENSVQMRFYEGKILSLDEQGQCIELDRKNLRSSLLHLMKLEAAEMCAPSMTGNGYIPPSIQLIYDEGSFSVITSSGPTSIPSDRMELVLNYGFRVPGPKELKEQHNLEDNLCMALKVQRGPSGEISVLKDRGYVLTQDYLLKMIGIHERQQCGMPVIITGETGVGKTFLLETLNDLYNFSQQQRLDYWRSKLKDFLSTYTQLHEENEEKMFNAIKSLPQKIRTQSLLNVYNWFQQMEKQNIVEVFSLIEPFSIVQQKLQPSFDEKVCQDLLIKFLFGKKRKLFRVFRVHTGLTPFNIRDFIQPIIDEECVLNETNPHRPKLTVFFDEVNTSSCIGFLKELIIDHSLDGKPLPDNIFIVAACNPHRGNSISTVVKPTGGSGNEKWFQENYLVRPLHPSFHQIMWDFGYLRKSEEDEYIDAKLKKIENTLTNSEEYEMLKANISGSQNLLREFTRECLLEAGYDTYESRRSSTSAVSQRDIQRVLKLYQWLKTSYKVLGKYGYCEDENIAHHNWRVSVRALYVSLALVYYFRLNAKYRKKYADRLDMGKIPVTIDGTEGLHITFTKAITEELEWLMQNIELPPGVADTKALRENLFAIITCCMTKIPLIIIGPPGSSKTLSFKIAVANLLGEVSPKAVFRSEVMKGLEPHIYQCSKYSLSEDIDALFEKAILRQKQINSSGQNATVVVFMDEAGLPDEKLQVLKVLHYHLDNPQVPFVAFTNIALDAAKSNRAICLFQINNTKDDLYELAAVMLGFKSEQFIPSAIKFQIKSLIEVYLEKMEYEEFNSIFGLRDIMHFFSYLRRRMVADHHSIPAELIVSSLQRNFSGAPNFDELAQDFLIKCGLNISQIPSESISCLRAFENSLADKPKDLTYENEVRYKLLICQSEDESLVKLLFKFGILQRHMTKIYCLSKLPGDRLQKAIIVAKIKNSIVNGHTITLAQCDEIFESFYDLFNQRFAFIDDHEKNTRNYYARIASGAKSTNCLVDPSFQCIVLVKQSEVCDIPAPFMNRFEKYPLSYHLFLKHVFEENKVMLVILREASRKVEKFLKEIPFPGLYGFQDETLSSLVLAHVKMKEGSASMTDCIVVAPGGISILSALESYCSPQECNFNQLEIFEDIEYAISLMENKPTLTLKLITKMKEMYYDVVESKKVDDEDLLNCVHLTAQLLFIRLMKELLQFMPPEVFLAVKEKLPQYYVHSYLDHQFHFNLQELVKDRIKESFSGKKQTAANKILCYSRTTSFLFEHLPHEFFDYDNSDERNELKKVFPHLTDDNIASICIMQIFHNTTGSKITRNIKKFLFVDSYDVMLFFVNMEHISKDSVNYLRLAIDEADFEANQSKQFILLLHFPAENFFLHCYPSFCQDEWDFYYLDSVAPTAKGAVINLKNCFLYAYSQEDDKNTAMKFMDDIVDSLLSFELVTYSTALIRSILPEVVPRNAVSDLLSTDKYKSIGEALKFKFVQQWSSHRMMQTLQQAANSALSLDYTLNMTDAVSTIIKSNFYDFMHYMLTILARSNALFLLFRNIVPTEIMHLIRKQICSIDLPLSTTQMKLQTSSITPKKSYQIHFPFFTDVYDTVENVLGIYSATCAKHNSNEYANELKLKIKKNPLVLATVTLMGTDEKLWSAYMLQFLDRYHSVNCDSNLFSYFLLKSRDLGDISNRLVWLQCSFDLIPQNIISYLGLADATSKSKLSEENLHVLEDPKRCAEAVITRFFESLKSLSNKGSSDEFFNKIDQLVPKYHEMFLSRPLKDLIHMPHGLPPETEAKRDGIAVFFTLINTGIPHNIALDLLNHFTTSSFLFSETFDLRAEYLLKIPVEKILETPFPAVFTDEYATEYSMRYFLAAILEILIEYSSEQQKKVLNEWFCEEICTNSMLSKIPLKQCQDPESISSLCFIEKMFTIITSCGAQHHLNTMLDRSFSNKKNIPRSYTPYFMREIADVQSEDQHVMEPLMTLLYLKELKAKFNYANTQVANLVSEYHNIIKNSTADNNLLSCVLKEAIIFVIVQETAQNIVNRSDTLIREVDNIISKRNYGILLTYCIFKKCKSLNKLRKYLIQENELCRNFSCLHDMRQTYAKQKATFPLQPSLCDLFQAFSNKPVADSARNIFSKVYSSVREMVDSSRRELPQNLLDMMPLCCVISDHNKLYSTKCMFKISLFLSVYHFKADIQIQVPHFQKLMKEKANIYVESIFTDTLCAFISGERHASDHSKGLVAPLSASLSQKDDFKEMWDCAASLIAAILGASERFSNLTMHLETPGSLDGTYIPGSTTHGKVGKDKRSYQDSMGLSESGLCNSHSSYAYVVRGKASLPCLYFIQWANYTCLYTHLLGLDSSKREQPFDGELFEDPSSAMAVCLMSMERLWELFIRNFGITVEQRTILIQLCIGNLIEVWLDDKRALPAVASTQDEVDEYEKMYNDEVFLPSWQSMLGQVSKHKDQLKEESIDYKIMKLEETYPCFADEHSFLTFIMTSTSFYDDTGYYYPLYQFLLNRPKLYHVISVLPDLVDFYQWIHQQFPHCFTREESKLITVTELLRSENYSHVGYTSVIRKTRMAQYAKLCKSTQIIQTTYDVCSEISALQSDTFVSDAVCTREVAGLIKKWIDALINVNNSFLSRIRDTTFGLESDDIKRVSKTECKISSLDVGDIFKVPVLRFSNISDMMPLIENCCCLSSSCCSTYVSDEQDESLLLKIVPQVYHLSRLQKDVAVLMMSKLKLVNEIACMSFTFKNIQESVSNIFVESAAVGLDDLERCIPAEFKVKPNREYFEDALKHCHSLSYFSLLEITIGLRIAAEYLIQIHKEIKQNRDLLKTLTLESFLSDYVIHEDGANFTKIFSQALGIDVTRLNQLQIKFLSELKTGNIMKALKTFVSWLQDGLYDFSSFSVVLKENLSDAHQNLLVKIKNEAICNGKEHEFLETIRLVSHSLSICEKKVREITDSTACRNESLKDLLNEIEKMSFGKHFDSFPDVPISQYVRYRLALRMIHRDVLKIVQERASSPLGGDSAWSAGITRQQLMNALEIEVPEEKGISTTDSGMELRDLSCEQIAQFIRSIGLEEKYALSAVENEVDGESFANMKEKQLRRLLEMSKDPVAFLHVKVMIKRCYGSGQQAVSQIGQNYPPQRIAEICIQHECLRSAVPFVKKHNIDGEMMLEADVDVFKQISTNYEAAANIIKKRLNL